MILLPFGVCEPGGYAVFLYTRESIAEKLLRISLDGIGFRSQALGARWGNHYELFQRTVFF
jgi:hypothetical protein